MIRIVVDFRIWLSVLLIFSGCRERPEAYLLDEKELVPEGITYADSLDVFFLSSVAQAKIIEVDAATAKQTDFIKKGEFGFLPGVGIYADERADRLYAIGGNDSISALFVFSISRGSLIGQYIPPDGRNHFLNDLTMDTDKNIYITDIDGNQVWWLKNGSDDLALFLESDSIQYPNGIALSDDGQYLHIASFIHGVRTLNLKTKAFVPATPAVLQTRGIDGLEFYNGNLYGVQNGRSTGDSGFMRITLAANGDRILSVDELAHYPPYNLPLTFAIAGNQAVIITFSNLQHLDQKTMTFPYPDSLHHTVLKLVPLR